MSFLDTLFGRRRGVPSDLELLVTMWPSFTHFPRFVTDKRLSGVRLNTAMYGADEMDKEFRLANSIHDAVPLYFDIKGRQLRVVRAFPFPDRLELLINHPIKVKTPTMVIFKAGEDRALLKEVANNGRRLIFDGGPEYMVYDGESFHIRDPSLEVGGEAFVQTELDKLAKAKKAGISRYFLSYVQSQRDVDEFLNLVGRDTEVVLKIEDQRGLNYVANEFKKTDNISLMAARGDLYVEVERPHQILNAMKLIVDRDPRALVGSRIMLSVSREPVPDCADFMELAWMYDIGYRRMMLCDEICLKEELLSAAIDAFDCFRQSYVNGEE